MSHKLLVEGLPEGQNIEYVIEEKNLGDEKKKRMWITGEYACAGIENKNNRIYDVKEMNREVQRYVKEFVEPKRAMGELNHPTAAEVNLERACHLVTDLHMDRNIVMGKSLVLGTPTGQVLESLIKDGVQVGVSTRSLGKLLPCEGKDGINRVEDMRLIAVDCVADPSYPKAFVNGILESKQYVLASDGSYEELYDTFAKNISNLPRRDVDEYLRNQVIDFIAKISSKI